MNNSTERYKTTIGVYDRRRDHLTDKNEYWRVNRDIACGPTGDPTRCSCRSIKTGGLPMPRKRERYMTVLGGYTLDMEDHGHLVRETIDLNKPGDYGCDPLGDGTFRMVPSGDVVDEAERKRRLQ